MSAADDLRRVAAKLSRSYAVFREGVVQESFRSVVEGSELTGAPGQPIGETHRLHDSWQITREGTDALIASDSEYAAVVEHNTRHEHFQNHGPHSRDLTAAGFNRIVEHVAQGLEK